MMAAENARLLNLMVMAVVDKIVRMIALSIFNPSPLVHAAISWANRTKSVICRRVDAKSGDGEESPLEKNARYPKIGIAKRAET